MPVHIPPKPVSDAEHLELIARIIFVSGFKYDLVMEKWPAIKEAFRGFEVERVLELQVEDVLEHEGIIRNRMKVERVLRNAGECAAIIDEYGSMASWVAEVSARHYAEPLHRPSLRDECKRFVGIGERTSEWLSYVYAEGKPEGEVR